MAAAIGTAEECQNAAKLRSDKHGQNNRNGINPTNFFISNGTKIWFSSCWAAIKKIKTQIPELDDWKVRKASLSAGYNRTDKRHDFQNAGNHRD